MATITEILLTPAQESTFKLLSNQAHCCNVKIISSLPGEKPKTLWKSVGNTSGLHGYLDDLITEKWEKSGERFKKNLRAALAAGRQIELYYYRNRNRDSGSWGLVSIYQKTEVKK